MTQAIEPRIRRHNWEQLLAALGSSKPWVSRSLQPWSVRFNLEFQFWGPPISVTFEWGKESTIISIAEFQTLSDVITSGKHLVGSEPVLTEFGWISIRMGTSETSFQSYGVRVIPTKLIIEAIRISRLTSPTGFATNHYSCSVQRFSKRHRKYHKVFARMDDLDRKHMQKVRGDHNRWSDMAIITRQLEESTLRAPSLGGLFR